MGGFGAIQPRLAHQFPQHGQLKRCARPLVGHGGFGRDDPRALRLPVAISKPAMILPARVDDRGDRLISQTPDDLGQRLGTGPCAARIDQDRAVGRFDQPEGGVVAEVLGVALFGGSFDGPDAGGDLLGVQPLGEDRRSERGHDKRGAADQVQHGRGLLLPDEQARRGKRLRPAGIVSHQKGGR
ncbi:hypothetical protein KUV65_10845 [Maritalea mobilis]|uniref:hypothetical protein n=1 Tax=Maritalea mobilis TaxID=483324 RepID=UPI001C977DE9|nr:hypothetical protein [Maritalea mobilis]MBY6201861.1 hypothetical protein [Maritalea mobilis]